MEPLSPTSNLPIINAADVDGAGEYVPSSTVAWTIINDTLQNGSGFVSGPGQVTAVICYPVILFPNQPDVQISIIEVTSDEIRDALSDPISEVVEAIKISLEKTPPELAADIVDNGIILAGGGSLLANLDVLIKEKTGLPVSLAEDPLTCVVRGCGKALESISLLRQVTTLS